MPNKKTSAPRPYSTVTLPSGLRVLTVPLQETKAVTALVLCKVGSRFESPDVNGISHFIEHLMFKGTARRPNTLAISKLLDGVGAEYNAFTGKDYTGYYVKLNSEKLDLALDVVSDMLYNSKFDPKEIDRERQVIIEEISMYEDNPLMHIDDIFEAELFSGHPLGQLISGPRQVIRDVSRRTILDYLKRHYFPKNMMVGVAGRFDPKTIESKVQGYFSAKAVQRRPLPLKPFKFKSTGPRVRLEHKDTEQVQLCLGFPAISYFDKRLPALTLLSTILGGNMSSRLFISIRERRGLAYSVKCGLSIFEDTGALYVQAGVAKERTVEAITAIRQELERAVAGGVTAAELNRAKEFINGKLVLDLEDSENLGAWFAKQWLLVDRIETPAQKLAKIRAVTRADIQAAAKQFIIMNKSTLALIGPFKDSRPFRKLIG